MAYSLWGALMIDATLQCTFALCPLHMLIPSFFLPQFCPPWAHFGAAKVEQACSIAVKLYSSAKEIWHCCSSVSLKIRQKYHLSGKFSSDRAIKVSEKLKPTSLCTSLSLKGVQNYDYWKNTESSQNPRAPAMLLTGLHKHIIINCHWNTHQGGKCFIQLLTLYHQGES